jgi:hypothetical protein
VKCVYSKLDAAVFGTGSKELSADARAADWLKSGEGSVATSGRVWRVGRDVKRGLVKFFCEDGTTGRRDHGPYPIDPSAAIVCGEVQQGCGHLQGVATDGTNLYWSSTKRLVKTDATGKVLVARDVESHHGDLCVAKGVLYVAVNLGKFNTDNLANAELEAPDFSDVSIEGFNVVSGQGTGLAKFYSASLILKSETTLRFFFQVDSAATFTATYNGQTLEVKQRSGLYYVDVVGIAAKDLDEEVTITINDGSGTAVVSFNPMAYCQGVLNDTTGAFGAEMKDLARALYLYNQAANVYFEEV